MLIRTKPSAARCNDAIYISYLLSEPEQASCMRLSKIMENISHDSINRFLERERYEPKRFIRRRKAR